MKHSNRPTGEPLVLHVTNAPTPYRLPQFREFRLRLSEVGYDFHVHFLGRRKRERSWIISDDAYDEFRFTVGGEVEPEGYKGAVEVLRRLRPSVVVLAWAMDATALRLMLYCLFRRIPCILYTGLNRQYMQHTDYRLLREMFRIPFFRFPSGYIAYGSSTKAYLQEKGIAPEAIAIAINVVDTDFFRSRVDELRGSGAAAVERGRYRARSGESPACHFLFVGYLVDLKGLDPTLDALVGLGRNDIVLHLVGSGPEEERLRERIRALGLEDTVILHGYRQQSELPIFYAMADALLFPSRYESFGLVMVEAAAAALPIIASVHAGGTPDVVQEGVNGYVVDPWDIDRYAEAMRKIADDSSRRARMGEASRRIADESLTLRRSAEGYALAIGRILGDVARREDNK